MTAKWEGCAILAICLALLVGCRASQPKLKPADSAEKFVSPPQEARYDTAGYPSAALDKPEDPMRRAIDTKNGVIPTRGSSMGGPGGGGSR